GVLLSVVGVAVAGIHGWAWYHFLAGRAALERYHAEEAQAHLDACLKVWPGSAETHLLASRAARRADDYESAERHLRECQRLRDDPDNVRALMLKGQLFRQVQTPLKAIPEYRRVLELDTEQREVRWQLARCLLEIGRYDEALTHLEQVRKYRPDDAEVLVRIA